MTIRKPLVLTAGQIEALQAGDRLEGVWVWQGAWSGATAYVVNDVVQDSGSAYICILAHTNHQPPNGTYWELVASKGDTGATGSTGATGREAGIKYIFDSSTSSGDPGTGEFRLNGVLPGLSTEIYISETDADGNLVNTWIQSWDDSTSTTKAHLFIQVEGDPTSLNIYSITGSVTDNGTWDTYTITPVVSSGSITNGQGVRIWVERFGNTGATGSTGAAGGADTITSDTTLYVATTGNDTTGTGLTIGAPWLTVGKALSYLATKYISNDATVTIQLADGNYAISSALAADHACSEQIVIKGTNVYTTTITSIQTSSGSAGAYSYILNVASIANLAVGDYIFLSNAANGTLPGYLNGCHKITNVDAVNTRITVTVKHYNASKATGVVTGNLSITKTTITTTSCNHFQVYPNSGITLKDMVLVGDATPSTAGVFIGGATTSRNGNGHVTLQGSFGTDNCGYGIYNRGGSVTSTDIPSIAGSITNGIRFEIGARGWFNSGVVINGGSSAGQGIGLRVMHGASFYGQNSIITGNNSHGVTAETHAQVWVKSGDVTGNLAYGVYARTHSFVEIGGGTVTGNFLAGLVSDGCGTISRQEANMTLTGTLPYADVDRSTFFAPLPSKYRNGFLWKRNAADTTNDIDVTAGECRDGDDTDNMYLTGTYTKRLDAAWAVGSGSGGLDTGARANNTWYYIWIIKRPDTKVVDVLLSASSTSPTMPTNYVQKRLVGALRTGPSLLSQVAVRKSGEGYYVQYLDPNTNGYDVNTADMTTSRTTRTLNYVPPLGGTNDFVEFDCLVEVNPQATTDGAGFFCYITSPDTVDTAPSSTTIATNSYFGNGTVSQINCVRQRIFANHSAQIVDRANSGTLNGIKIMTFGWFWPSDL